MVAECKITPNILGSKADWHQFFVIGHFDKTSGQGLFLYRWRPVKRLMRAFWGRQRHVDVAADSGRSSGLRHDRPR